MDIDVMYETYHHVTVSDKLIRQIVIMSEKYIHDRFLPDKAIDILDEACSKVNLTNKVLAQLEILKTFFLSHSYPFLHYTILDLPPLLCYYKHKYYKGIILWHKQRKNKQPKPPKRPRPRKPAHALTLALAKNASATKSACTSTLSQP